jgi:TPP-dependent trihydroxycyclohexane-1,2-dione (THcHDO) dehydratase
MHLGRSFALTVREWCTVVVNERGADAEAALRLMCKDLDAQATEYRQLMDAARRGADDLLPDLARYTTNPAWVQVMERDGWWWDAKRLHWRRGADGVRPNGRL